jgi:20S proteasome alpha/beta subunit
LNPKPPVKFTPKRLPERKKLVTIAIGLMHDEGLLLCADTRMTSASKLDEPKLKGFVFSHAGDSIMMAALAGNVAIARMAIADFGRALNEIPKEKMKLETMVDAIRSVLLDTYQKHIYPNPDRASGEYDIQFIIALWSHIDGLAAYSTSGTAITQFHYSECVGAGSYLASYLLAPHVDVFLKPESWMTSVACHVLKEVKTHDSQCGGSTDMVSISNKGVIGQQWKVFIEEDEEYAEAFMEAIKFAFVALGDMDMADAAFNRELRDIVKDLRRIRRTRKKKRAISKERSKSVVQLLGPANH